ncbi:MAG: tetratricopeptide repeat protein [Cyanobacteriota bacterium]
MRQPRAFMVLGVLCGERGDRTERRLWFRQARRFEEASGEPLSLRLLLNQLVDALEQGEPEQALAYGEEALALYPSHWEAHLHQAHVFLSLGQVEAAKRHLDHAHHNLRALNADDPAGLKAWRQLAEAEILVERPDAAIEAYSHALALDPNHLPSLLSISRLLVIRGSIDGAMPWLLNALAVAPEDVEVLCCNGVALKAIGEMEQAKELFRQALVIDPTHVEASTLLAGCLSDQGLCHEAVKVYREALIQTPENMDCRLGLASALRGMGDFAACLPIQEEMLKDDPAALGSFGNWMFTTSITDLVTPAAALDAARRFWAGQGVVDRAPWTTIPASPPATARPLRVGLLSADIGDHVVGRFLDPLLRHHDPSRCQLELVSMRRLYDRDSEKLVGFADGFHSLEGLPDNEARALLRERGYDLIVDTSGYTRGSGLHLLAERCAPVQAHYIGYHATTGLPTIDAFIGDQETAAPELQEQFSEQLWCLPRPWLAYPKERLFPKATPLMQIDRPVLGAFCQVSKISDATLKIWGQVLSRLPDALLVLKDRGLLDPVMRQRLEDRLAERGVHPGRVTFLAPLQKWQDHVDHYNLLDIALDTTPWSSATTGFEALAMGVPLVAIRGNRMAARMSSSLVKGLGRREWIGETAERIADIVAELCADLPTLRKEKAARQREVFASPLFDGADLANQVMNLFSDLVSSVTESKREPVGSPVGRAPQKTLFPPRAPE